MTILACFQIIFNLSRSAPVWPWLIQAILLSLRKKSRFWAWPLAASCVMREMHSCPSVGWSSAIRGPAEPGACWGCSVPAAGMTHGCVASGSLSRSAGGRDGQGLLPSLDHRYAVRPARQPLVLSANVLACAREHCPIVSNPATSRAIQVEMDHSTIALDLGVPGRARMAMARPDPVVRLSFAAGLDRARRDGVRGLWVRRPGPSRGSRCHWKP